MAVAASGAAYLARIAELEEQVAAADRRAVDARAETEAARAETKAARAEAVAVRAEADDRADEAAKTMAEAKQIKTNGERALERAHNVEYMVFTKQLEGLKLDLKRARKAVADAELNHASEIERTRLSHASELRKLKDGATKAQANFALRHQADAETIARLQLERDKATHDFVKANAALREQQRQARLALEGLEKAKVRDGALTMLPFSLIIASCSIGRQQGTEWRTEQDQGRARSANRVESRRSGDYKKSL